MVSVMKDSKGFGLVELMIVLAIVVFILDISIPKVQSYISNKKEHEDSSAVLEVAVYNVKTYVNELNKSLILDLKDSGSYYVSDMKVTIKGTLPSGDSWIVIDDNKVIQGLFKQPCGKSYAYISYDGEQYEILEDAELTVKP